ncbi:MAG: nickel-dependent lactate racemase [Spirochaetia bacterium]|nr:nickel-dependent lactate racemase [Spirochaetia bacterium]
MSQKIKLAYGKGHLEVSLPKDALVIEPRSLPALANESERAKESLRSPVGTKPLRDQVKPTDKVAIVISDITRPTPNHKLVPWLLEELAHVPKKNFVVINGLGSHRANTNEELTGMLGAEVMKAVRVVNHEAFDKKHLVDLGKSPSGGSVFLNREYIEADFRISTGFIEPHFFAGFSGGPKCIMPGIAGIETILHFHSAALVGHSNSTWGILDGNPLQQEAVDICRMAPPHFMWNVSLNNQKKITGFFAGETMAAHRKGCAFVKEHAMAAVDAPFDLVITTNSGYPLDQNLYQTVKGMSAAQKIVRKDGVILAVSECSDGFPEHGHFKKILGMRSSPIELLKMIEDPGFSMFDQWQVQKQAMVQTWAKVSLHSSLPENEVRAAHLEPVSDIETFVQEWAAKNPGRSRIAVLPYGPLTIPYLKQ